MPSFGVGAADQYLAIIDAVVAFPIPFSIPASALEIGLVVSNSVDLVHVEFDL